MGYDPRNKIEKIAFRIAGINRIAISQTLPSGEMSAVANFWLARSNTSTVFSTICLTSAIVLFVETKNWLIFTPFLVMRQSMGEIIKSSLRATTGSEAISSGIASSPSAPRNDYSKMPPFTDRLHKIGGFLWPKADF